MGWVLLGVAILSEVGGTIALRQSDGFSRPIPSAAVVVGYALSFWLMALVLRSLPLSVTYAVWAGVGTALTVLAGVWFFAERITPVGVAGIALVLVGVVLLQLGTTAH